MTTTEPTTDLLARLGALRQQTTEVAAQVQHSTSQLRDLSEQGWRLLAEVELLIESTRDRVGRDLDLEVDAVWPFVIGLAAGQMLHDAMSELHQLFDVEHWTPAAHFAEGEEA